MNFFLVASTILLLVSCSSGSKKENDSVELQNGMFTAQNFYQNGERDAEWKIEILNRDSIIILASTGENFSKQFCYDHQIYGKLINSDEFDYEIIPKVEFYGSGCSKPHVSFLYSDSIPFYVDSTLLKYFHGSKIKIESNAGIETNMKINSTLNIFRSILDNGNLDTSDYKLTIYPTSAFNFHSFTLKTGDRCAASISNYDLRFRYFLKKTHVNYVLIIDKREYYGKSECIGCFDTIVMKNANIP